MKDLLVILAIFIVAGLFGLFPPKRTVINFYDCQGETYGSKTN